jgi:SAM-dependent methyltransferase
MANLWELSDLATPWCVHVAATLRIAERIAGGVDEIGALAAAANCDRQTLHRVLDLLVSKGVFEQPKPGHFALNQAARALLNPGVQLSLDLDGLGGRMAHAWSTLLDFVRTGEPAYSRLFGRGFWEDLDAHPELSAQFDALIGPAGHGMPSPRFDLAAGWEGVRTVVDVGGGTGAMLAEILRSRPGVRGTLVDLPRTVARSNGIFAAAGVADRVNVAGQSFFDPLPPGADLYLLRGILNDWPDREAAAILLRCAEAARPEGRVVVLKGVRPDGAPRPLTIEMVLVGGKHRSVSELCELANHSGLQLVAAGSQAEYFVVEFRPA